MNFLRENKLLLFGTLAAVVLVVILALGTTVSSPGDCLNFEEGTLTVGDTTLSIGIAESSPERTRGLSGCDRVPDGKGLYFPYNEPSAVQFWMKDMLIPIDIVWIRDGVVIGVADHVPPPAANTADQELIRYKPPQSVTAVLEVGAGKAAAYGLTEGAPVSL